MKVPVVCTDQTFNNCCWSASLGYGNYFLIFLNLVEDIFNDPIRFIEQ